MKKYIDNLKRRAEENPLVAATLAVTAATAVAKLMSANTERQNSKTWKREVDRRRMNSRR